MGFWDKVGKAVDQHKEKEEHFYQKLSSKSDSELREIARNGDSVSSRMARKILRERGY